MLLLTTVGADRGNSRLWTGGFGVVMYDQAKHAKEGGHQIREIKNHSRIRTTDENDLVQ